MACGTLFYIPINGQGVPEGAQRKSLEGAFAGVLLRELVTTEAIDEAFKAARKSGPEITILVDGSKRGPWR